MDQLLMHVTTAIHNKSWNLVHMHAAMASSSNPEDLSKRPYPELCQTVTIHHFLPCMVDLAKVYTIYIVHLAFLVVLLFIKTLKFLNST